MSEGGSANVTTGVATRQVPMPPESPRKRMESLIDDTIKKTAEKKLEEILTESVARLSVGDYIQVGRKKGKVIGTGGAASDQVGVAPTQNHVLVEYDNGTSESFDPREKKFKILKKNPEYDALASTYKREAGIAKRQNQFGRMHEAMANYHKTMVKHFEWFGNKTKAAEHEKMAKQEEEASKKSYTRAATIRPVEPQSKYEYSNAQKDSWRKHAESERDKQRSYAHARKIGIFQHYFLVPFKDKDKARAMGLMWDPKEKKWFEPSRTEIAPTDKYPWKYSHTYSTGLGRRM